MTEKWRCMMDKTGYPFDYCQGVPDWGIEPHRDFVYNETNQGEAPRDAHYGVCKLDPATCGKHIKFSELVKEDKRLVRSGR